MTKIKKVASLPLHENVTKEESIKHIVQTMIRFVFVGTVLGIHSPRLNDSSGTTSRKMKCFHILYFLTFLMLYSFLWYYTITSMSVDKNVNVRIHRYLLTSHLVISVFSVYVALILSSLVRSVILKCIGSLAQIDVIFSKNGLKINYIKLKKSFRWLFIYAILRFAIMFALSFYFYKMDYLQRISMFTAHWMKTYLKLSVFSWMIHLNIRFQEINEAIKITLTPTKVCSDFYTYNQTIVKLTDRLHILCRMHYKLCNVTRQLNVLFALQLIFCFGVTFAAILFYSTLLYSVFYAAVHHGSVSVGAILFSVSLLADEYWEIYILVNGCSSVCNNANQTPKLLHEIRNNSVWDEEIESHIQTYSLQFFHQKLKITAMKFFDVNFSVLYGIFSSTATYLVIFIQMEQGGI